DRLLRCPDGEGAGRRPRAEQGDLRGAGRRPGRAEGSAGAMGGTDGRSQVLAASSDRVTESRGEGHFHRLRGRAERISGSHRSGVSADRSTAVHRASGAGFAKLRALETAQGCSRGSAFDLSRRHGRRGGTASGGTGDEVEDRKSTRLNSSHSQISYAVFCLKKKKKKKQK